MKTNYKLKMPSKNGSLIIAFFMVFMMVSFFAEAQTQLKLTIECHGRVEVFDRGAGTAVTTIQGPVVESTLTLAAGQLMRLRTVIPSQITSHKVTEWDWTNPYSSGDPVYVNDSSDDFIDLVMGGNGTIISVIAYFDVRDPNIAINDFDIESVTKTPVILPVDVEYDVPDNIDYAIFNDPIIGPVKADLRMEIPGGFPTGAELLKVSLDGGNTNLLNSTPTDIGGLTEVFIYDLLSISPPSLVNKEGSTDNFEFTFAGIDDPVTIPFTITVFGYVNQSVCYTDFETGNYSLTFRDTQVVSIDDFSECYDDCIEFDYVITYPAITNLDTRVMNDAKITIYTDYTKTQTLDVAIDTQIDIDGPFSNTYTFTGAYSTFYLSALLNDLSDPTVPSTQGVLLTHNGATHTWTFTICDGIPGNFYVVIEQIATLDGDEFTYDGDEFLVQYVGALDVDIDAIDDISTVNKTPVIVPVSVTYPDFDLQNIDPAIQTDARISTPLTGGFPADAEIIKITYQGVSVFTGNYSIGGSDDFLLSDVLGSTSPLIDHSELSIDWEITVVGIDFVGTVSITVEGIAYLNINDCYSVLDSESFTVTYAEADFVLDIDEPVCEGEEVVLTVDLIYPAIVNVPNTVISDVLITVSPTLNASDPVDLTFEISWDGGTTYQPSVVYSLAASQTTVYMSTILASGDVSFNTLNGISNVRWRITLDDNIPFGDYDLQFEPMAKLDGVEYIYDLEAGSFKIYEPVTADAGTDQLVCNSVSAVLAANDIENEVPGAQGQWTYVGPVSGNLSFDPDVNAFDAEITADVAGVYTLTWNTWNGGTFDPFEPVCYASDDVVITFLKGTKADGYNIAAIDDIDAVVGVPIVTKYTYYLPDNDITADPNIILDGLFHIEGGFPAGAKVIELRRTATITTTWFPVADDDVGGKEYVFLSDLIGIEHPLSDNALNVYNWVLTVEGFDQVATYTATLSLITYINKPVDMVNDCYSVLDSETFIMSFDEAEITTPDDCIVACYDPDDQLHALDFDIEIEYPLINNVDVDDEITLDARISITAGNPFNNVSVYWGYNGSATNLSTHTFTGQTEVLLSEIVGGSPTPLSDHSGTDVWSIQIVGLDPGKYDLKVEALALIEVVQPTPLPVQDPPSTYLLPDPSDYKDFEYVYAESTFCLNVVGAYTVSIDIEPDVVETVTGAPVIFEVEVEYPDLVAANIDPSVMVDAMIVFNPPLPEDAYIVELLYSYDGAPAVPIGMSTPTIGGLSSVLLSQIIGAPAPTPLVGHSEITDTWTLTIAGVDEAGTYVAAFHSIAYVDFDVCYSVMAVGLLTVTFEDLDVTANQPAAVCEDEVIDDSTFTITYPVISNNNTDVLTDAIIKLSIANTAVTIINWDYANGAATGSYNLPAGDTEVKLSTIVGGTAPNPLQGHAGTIAWEFEFEGLVPGQYIVTVEPIATLNGEDYALIHNDMPLEQILFVYPKYEPVISGDTPVYSGSTTTYSIPPQDVFGPLFNEESWVLVGDVEFDTNGNLVFSGGTTTPTATIETACPGTFSFDYEISTTTNTLVYLEVIGILTPVFNGNVNGTVTGTFNGEISGTYVLTRFTSDPAAVTITISNFNFDVDQSLLAWDISNINNTSSSPSGGSVSIVGPTSNTYSVDVEAAWPFVGTYSLTVSVANCAGCTWSNTLSVEVLPNTVLGQVKYYNQNETPMPSPYSFDWLGASWTDYFYVSLVTNTWDVNNDNPVDQSDVVETVRAEAIYFEGDPLVFGDETELLAAFEFEHNLNPAVEYRIVVWDGAAGIGLKNNPLPIPDNPGLMNLSWTWNNWNSQNRINATDALMIMHMVVNNDVNTFPNMGHIGYKGLTPRYGAFANYIANVNNSVNSSSDPTLTSLDALLTMRRALGLIPVFPVPGGANPKPNFAVAGNVMELPEINAGFADAAKIFGTSLPNLNFSNRYGIVAYHEGATTWDFLYYSDNTQFSGDNYLAIYYNNIGDIRSRTVPDVAVWKTEPDIQLVVDGEIFVGKGEVVEVPISIARSAELGAISLGINFNNKLIEVLETNHDKELVYISNEEGQLRLVWYDVNGTYYPADDVIATITVRVLSDLDASIEIFELDGFTELANTNAEIVYVDLKTVALNTSGQVVGIDDLDASALNATNYPNPFSNQTTISYNLPETGQVEVIVYNKFGQVIDKLIDEIQEAGVHTVEFTDRLGSGLYYYRISLKGETGNYSVTKSMIVVR